MQMIFYIFPIIITSLASCIIFSISPLTLGLWIIIITLSISIFFSYFILSWFALILFLIYVGGLLVIFSYFVAIQPNQQLGFIKIITISITSLIYFSMLRKKFFIIDYKINNLFLDPSIIITNHYYIIILFLVIVLFLALIAVVKITFSSKSPLRPFLYVFSNTKIPPINKKLK